MKRSAFDVIRRGFDNALANWPLILLRLGEAAVFIGIVVASIFAAVIPILVSAGMRNFDFGRPDSVAEFFGTLVIEHWILIVYLFVLFFVLFGVLTAIHSFVEAGCARVYVDAERAADLRAFDAGRWFRGGAAGWWRLFWIYNLAWSVGCLVLLVPLVITIAGLLVIDQSAGKVAIGCSGLGFTALIAIPTFILISIWVNKAIAVCVGRAIGAVESLRVARRDMRLDFGRHLGVGLVMIIIGIMAGAVVSGVSFPFNLGGPRHGGDFGALLPLLFAPMQIVGSLIQAALSAAVSSWTLASFVALAEER